MQYLQTFHKQSEKHGGTIMAPLNMSTNRQSANLLEQCKKCCEMYEITQLRKAINSTKKDYQLVDKSIQTITVTNVKTQSTMTISKEKEKTSSQLPLKEWKMNQETNGTNVLSREKILKLLDQAQINTSLDASRIASKEEYTSILDLTQKHRQVVSLEKLLFGDSNY